VPGQSADNAGGPLEGKTVVLGVCGGIAAYKAVELCRRLSDAGALVLPVLTRAATRFVGPLTFSALAAEPARLSLLSAGADSVPHISLARRAELVVVAPATARLIGSYAAGISSGLLSATLLATRAPVLICPSMHTEMWEHSAVQDNVALLRRRGVQVLEPDEGRLAGGDVGKGRLPAPERIVAAAAQLVREAAARASAGAPTPPEPAPSAEPAARASAGAPTPPEPAPSAEPAARASAGPLSGVKAVVSAGGTREPLDPVRYIGNRSTGKQGYAVAAELAARGAEVVLVSASELPAPTGTDLVHVDTAEEMAQAVLSAAAGAGVVVMAAAVADYRPEHVRSSKLKKSSVPISVQLVPTEDILSALGTRRRPAQVIVGFAAETATGPQLVQLGRAKLLAKGADLVVANNVSALGGGFGSDWSEAVIVSREQVTELGLVDKRSVASKLADAIEAVLRAPALDR
jgi:phosphopantothenoylcysteine decarboxylase/phosphopantothenate--cysteine ligase